MVENTNEERKRQLLIQQPPCQINAGISLAPVVSENIYNTMSVANLSLPGESLHQRFSVIYVTQSNWNSDVYKNGTLSWGPITPWWSPTTHMVTMPICVYKYSPPGNVNNVIQNTYQFCYTHGSNVMTTLTQCQHYSWTLTKSKLQFGKSGLWIFQQLVSFISSP